MVIPVLKYIQILRIISEGPYNVNTIIRHTGKKNKGPILQALKKIEKEELIMREKDSQHSQYEYITLTKLGYDIVTLVNDFEKFKDGYYRLFEKLSHLPPIPKGHNTIDNYNMIKDDLKAKNWKEEDIDNYIDIIAGVNFYKTCVIRNISDIVTNRCLKLFINYKVGEIGRSILKHITHDVIDFKLYSLSEMINDIKNNDRLNNVQINDFQQLFEKSSLTDISRFYYFVASNFNEDFKESVVAYFNLISLSKRTIKTIMEEETNSNDIDRAIKKSENYSDIGEIFFTELAKKGLPYSTITSIFLSNIAKDYNPKPDSRFIKSVYNSL